MILTRAKLKKIREIQRSLEAAMSHAAWGGSRKRLFVIAEGTLRNRIRLLGPDSKFSGLDNLITTGKGTH